MDTFAIDLQHLKEGTVSGCTISVILFMLVKEMHLRSTSCDSTLVKTPLREFMDDIAVLPKYESATEKASIVKSILQWKAADDKKY